MCEAHKIKAVITLKSSQDDSEHDLCPECYEAFNLIVSGAFFADAVEEDIPKRGRPRKEAAT